MAGKCHRKGHIEIRRRAAVAHVVRRNVFKEKPCSNARPLTLWSKERSMSATV